MGSFLLHLDLIGITLAILGILFFPIYNRINIRRDNFYNMINIFEGFFYSSARHSVYNSLRLAEVALRNHSDIISYNIQKQKYDYSLISDFKKEFVVIFPAEFVKKLIQYELLSRNFNSDLDFFILTHKEKQFSEEETKRAVYDLNEKNIRLFQLANHCRNTLEHVRVNIIESASKGIQRTKFYEKRTESTSKFIIITAINQVWKPIKAFSNIIYTFYCDFISSNPAFKYLQRDKTFNDELVIDESSNKLKADFGHYVSVSETTFSSLYNDKFDGAIAVIKKNLRDKYINN